MRRLLTALLLTVPLGFGLVGCETYRSSTVRYRTVYRRASSAPVERVPLGYGEERIEVEDPAMPAEVDERAWLEENHFVRENPTEVYVVEEIVEEEPVYVDTFVDTGWSLWLDFAWSDRHRRDRRHYDHRRHRYDRHPAPRRRIDDRDRRRSDHGRRDAGRADRSHDRSRSGDRGRDRATPRSSGSRGDRSASRGRPSNERLRSMGRSTGRSGGGGSGRGGGRGGDDGGGNRRRP